MKRGGDLHPARPDWWPPTKRPRAAPGELIAASVTCLSRREGVLPCLRTSPPLDRTLEVHRTSWYIPFPRHACMFLVMGSRGAWVSEAPPRVPKQGRPWDAALPPVSGSRLAWSPAWHGLPQCPGHGHWVSYFCLTFVFGPGLCLGSGFGNPASRCWGPGWLCLSTACGFTPPLPAGVCDVCSWAWVLACTPGLGFQLRPATPGLGVGVCVCLCARHARSSAPPGWGCGAGVSAWAWVAAAPCHTWLGCWGVCAFVCAFCLYPTISGFGVRCGRVCWARVSAVPRNSWLGPSGVCVFVHLPPLAHRQSWRGGVCVCGFGFRLLSGFFLAWVLRRLASYVRRVRFPSPSRRPPVAWGCASVAVGVVYPPPSPLVFLFGLRWGGVWFSALSCRAFVVSVAGCPGLGSRGLRPSFPSHSGCAFVCVFVFARFRLSEGHCQCQCQCGRRS